MRIRCPAVIAIGWITDAEIEGATGINPTGYKVGCIVLISSNSVSVANSGMGCFRDGYRFSEVRRICKWYRHYSHFVMIAIMRQLLEQRSNLCVCESGLTNARSSEIGLRVAAFILPALLYSSSIWPLSPRMRSGISW